MLEVARVSLAKARRRQDAEACVKKLKLAGLAPAAPKHPFEPVAREGLASPQIGARLDWLSGRILEPADACKGARTSLGLWACGLLCGALARLRLLHDFGVQRAISTERASATIDAKRFELGVAELPSAAPAGLDPAIGAAGSVLPKGRRSGRRNPRCVPAKRAGRSWDPA
jgi:hypothetical protein